MSTPPHVDDLAEAVAATGETLGRLARGETTIREVAMRVLFGDAIDIEAENVELEISKTQPCGTNVIYLRGGDDR